MKTIMKAAVDFLIGFFKVIVLIFGFIFGIIFGILEAIGPILVIGMIIILIGFDNVLILLYNLINNLFGPLPF